MANKIKYLFIELEAQDGERRHTHRILHTTKAKNIHFAAEIYATHFYPKYSDRSGNWWYFDGGSVAVRIYTVKEITKAEYDLMYKIFH